ncbi:MAG: hypothetical protein ACFFCW_17560 [Candidatus Hodarchaeota archaeon]
MHKYPLRDNTQVQEGSHLEIEISTYESRNTTEKLRLLVNGAKLNRGSKRRYQCARCATPIQWTEAFLTRGCPFCGAKTVRFKTQKEELAKLNTNPENEFGKDSPDVIRLVQPGIYQINLEALGVLLKKTNEPLVLSAKKGIFKISFPVKE